MLLIASGFWDDNPQYGVGDEAGYAAGDEQDDEQQTESKSGNTEEFAQVTADSGNNPVMP